MPTEHQHEQQKSILDHVPIIKDLWHWAITAWYALRKIQYHRTYAIYIGWLMFWIRIAVIVGVIALIGYQLIFGPLLIIPMSVKVLTRTIILLTIAFLETYPIISLSLLVAATAIFFVKLIRYPRCLNRNVIPVGLGFSLDLVPIEHIHQLLKSRRDIIKEFDRLITQNKTTSKFKLYIFNDYLSMKIHRNANDGDFRRNIIDKTGIGFISFGYPLVRSGKYLFDMRNFVSHSPTSQNISDDLSFDMTIFKNNQPWVFSFEEYGEMNESVAQNTEQNAAFSLGAAAVISGHTEIGRSLLNEVKNISPKVNFKIKINKYIARSYLIDAINIYKNNAANNISDALKTLDKAIAVNPNEYSFYLQAAYLKFKNHDMPGALQSTADAAGAPNTSPVWRLNKPFMNLYAGKFDDAIAEYKSIEARHLNRITLEESQSIIISTTEVIEQENKIEFFYTLIFVYAKILKNKIKATDYLTMFKEIAHGDPKFNRLIKSSEDMLPK
ncbi:hypothetical protein M1506_03490 [Patescibacteria group bacterium]|nr:hypothetical protein [Patescibacteria group bacterium]